MESSSSMQFLFKLYGRKGPPLLSENTLLLDRYFIKEIIGGGGYGQVYRVVDQRKNLELAVKVEPKDHHPGRLIQERRILIKLNGTSHFPVVRASGVHRESHFFIMDLLGPSLSQLRKLQDNASFSPGTVLRVVLQVLNALKSLHNLGYIHRDVKPSNLCIGAAGFQRRWIYLVDFGLSRSLFNKERELRAPRKYVPFRGTVKYASLNMHDRKEQGPADDLICLFYSTIEMAEGGLPWKGIRKKFEAMNEKRSFCFEHFASHLPKRFKDFYSYLSKLDYKDKPDYELLRKIVIESMPSSITDQTPYDWEDICPVHDSGT
ncbi:hypothetical protein FO519_004697 [Halicephalobus sp. NKZ332]|nr:hypothetical protein FO519_004697 [Halicephalobus sp. NKZ332]